MGSQGQIVDKVYPRLPFWNITWYEVDQGEGDMIYIPAGGMWHSVISFTDTVSISFNMLNKYDYNVSMASLCKQGDRLRFDPRLQYAQRNGASLV